MADPTQQMQQMLNTIETGFGGANTAAQQLASALLQAARSSTGQSNAADASARSMAAMASRAEAVQSGFKSMREGFGGLINQATVLTANMYGADRAFSSVIPVLDAIGPTLGKFIAGLGLLASGASIAGAALGKASETVAKFANSGLDVITGILKFQLEASQKVADSYLAASKAGALFGGSFTRLGAAAAEVYVPIQTLVKVITDNAESLSKLGMGQEKAGLLVAGMSKQVFNTSESLRILYGGFDGLAAGVAEYLELQSQLGIDVQRDYKINKDAAIEYLFRQKELSAITGKNTELLKKEEQGRRTQLDYNLKLGRLGDVAKANVAEGMALSGKLFGDMGAKYAQEYFATGGKVVSRDLVAWAAGAEESAAAIGHLMGTVNQSAEGFRESNAAYLKANAPALEAFARSQEEYAELNRAANNSILRARTETGAAILENMTLLRNMGDQYAIFLADRLKRTTEPLDAPTKAYADAQVQMLSNQRAIDDIVLQNMEGMGRVVDMLNRVQQGFISMQGDASAALADMIKVSFQGTDAITNFINKFIERVSQPAALPGGTAEVPPGPAAAPPAAAPATPQAPITTGAAAIPSESTQARAAVEESRTEQARLQTEIDNLNKSILAMVNRAATPGRPGDEAQTTVLSSMLVELRDHSSKLDRIRDALA